MILRSLSAILVATVLFSMTSCNSSDQSKDGKTGDTATIATPDVVPSTPASTIVTTPQTMLVVRHKVKDFAKWMVAYDGHDTARLAAGIHSYVIGRGLQDSNMVLVAMKVDDTARANAFVKNPSHKTMMQSAGVIGTPNISMTTMTYQDTAMIASPLRSVNSFTVKDWATWLQHFETGAQQRKENGLMLRAYGHDPSDDHKVRVVTALVDSAKAVAYFKSDTLKKRMQQAGAIGQPDRFLYRTVRRY